jgi:hypothetical protein
VLVLVLVEFGKGCGWVLASAGSEMMQNLINTDDLRVSA